MIAKPVSAFARLRWSHLLCGFALLAAPAVLLAQGAASEWVHPGADGKLVYKTTASGDRIPDFSNCGYMGGGVALPDVPVRVTLAPAEGDSRGRIQEAIDKVSAMKPDASGFRGAVLLKKGLYRVGDTLRISTSGVVLRGEGQGPDGTVLLATKREQHTLVVVGGTGSAKWVKNSMRRIVDDYVPVGATRFELAALGDLKVGDKITVERPSTAEWIHAIGMDRIKHSPRTLKGEQQWKPGKYNMRYERVVTAIDGNTIEIDAPLVNSFDKKYGGGSIHECTQPTRIEKCGVETIRGDSVFDASILDEKLKGEYADEKHAWRFVEIRNADDCWVRNVTAIHFGYSCVSVGGLTRHITVQDCANMEPVSIVTGARRYSFALRGTLALVQRCYCERGRHDYVMHSRVPGPNVFLDCVATSAYNDSGPHQPLVDGDALRLPARGGQHDSHSGPRRLGKRPRVGRGEPGGVELRGHEGLCGAEPADGAELGNRLRRPEGEAAPQGAPRGHLGQLWHACRAAQFVFRPARGSSRKAGRGERDHAGSARGDDLERPSGHREVMWRRPSDCLECARLFL